MLLYLIYFIYKKKRVIKRGRRAEAADDHVQQHLICKAHSSLSHLGPLPCCYTHLSVCHFLSLHYPPRSSVSVCTTCRAHSDTGGWLGVSEFSLFRQEQYLFWCIFVSLMRTDRLVSDRRRMAWREGESEYRACLSILGCFIICQGFITLLYCFAASWAAVLICAAASAVH